MALDPTKNFAKVNVSTGYDASATSIVLETDEGAKLPDPSTDGNFNVVWYNASDYGDPSDDPNVEIVRVTGKSTDTLTVTRAQEDTTAKTHNTSGKTYKMILAITKKMMDDIPNIVNDTTPQLGGNLDAQDKNITSAGSIGFTQELDNGTKSANFSIDFSTDQKQKVTLTANTMTLTLDTTNIKVGNYLLKIVNGGLATLTWAAESGSIYWAGGVEPDLTSSGTDLLAVYFDGTNFYLQASLGFATV